MNMDSEVEHSQPEKALVCLTNKKAQCQKSIETLQEVGILSLREGILSKPSSDYCDISMDYMKP